MSRGKQLSIFCCGQIPAEILIEGEFDEQAKLPSEWLCKEWRRHPANTFVSLAATSEPPSQDFSREQIKELTAALEVPLDPSVIELRVTNSTKARETAWPGGSVCRAESIQPLCSFTRR
jgi:hypothetical protein